MAIYLGGVPWQSSPYVTGANIGEHTQHPIGMSYKQMWALYWPIRAWKISLVGMTVEGDNPDPPPPGATAFIDNKTETGPNRVSTQEKLARPKHTQFTTGSSGSAEMDQGTVSGNVSVTFFHYAQDAKSGLHWPRLTVLVEGGLSFSPNVSPPPYAFNAGARYSSEGGEATTGSLLCYLFVQGYEPKLIPLRRIDGEAVILGTINIRGELW